MRNLNPKTFNIVFILLARIIEDFELINELDGGKCYLEVKLCPLKYEIFRRPNLMLRKDLCSINCQDYNSQNHEVFIQDSLKNSQKFQEVRLKSRLSWTLGSQQYANWKKADFLLKSDTKLGGLLMYNTQVSDKAVREF